MRRKLITIRDFEDFLAKFKMFCFCHGSIQPCFDLQTMHGYYWKFDNGYSEKQLNQDIMDNAQLFKWRETKQFYYPNTNMFSGDNSQSGISGYIVTIRQEADR